jgi:ankyrin repeat protein
LRWLMVEDPCKQDNLKAVEQDGYTPLGKAVCCVRHFGSRHPWSGGRGNAYETAAFMCKLVLGLGDGDKSAYIAAPTSLLFCAAEWGEEDLLQDVLRLGVDVREVDANGRNALHHLNFGATPDIAKLLLSKLPRSKDAPTPAESLFRSVNAAGHVSHPSSQNPALKPLNKETFRLLLTTETLESENEAGEGIWTRFCKNVVGTWVQENAAVDQAFVSSAAALAMMALIEAGALGRYEAGGTSGLICFADSASLTSNAWTTKPVLRLWDSLLAKTRHRSAFISSPEAMTLINAAVTANHVEFLEMMLDHGVSVHQRATTGLQRTPIELACLPNGTTAATFDLLLRYATDAKLNELDSSKQAPIHYLTSQNVFQRDLKLKSLLKKGADPNLKRWGKAPALISYILDKQIDMAMVLINEGADPTARTKDGMDAILAAASRGSIRILERLRTKLAGSGYDWGTTCRSHFTILHPGGKQVTTAASGCNALHLASFNGHDLSLMFYLQNFPHVDKDARVQEDLRTPVHFAAIGGSVSCIRVLADHKADLNARMLDGSTPLHIAVRGSQVQAVNALLKLVPHDPVDKENLTPLFHALRCGVKEIIKMFMNLPIVGRPVVVSQKRKAEVARAVEMVISSGDLGQCKTLLAVTSAQEIRTALLKCRGCSPLTFAIRKQNPNIVNWLLEEIGCSGFIGSCLYHASKEKRGSNALNDICENPRLQACISPILDAYLEAGIPWPSMSAGALHSCAISDNVDGIGRVVQHIRVNALKYRYVSSPGLVAAATAAADTLAIIGKDSGSEAWHRPPMPAAYRLRISPL